MFCRAMLILVVAALLGGCDQMKGDPPAQLEPFESKEWKFKMKFPGKPESKEQDAKQQIGGKTIQIKIVMYTKSFRNEAFMVGVTDIPAPFEPDPIQTHQMLEKGRDGAMATSGATLETSNSILLQGRYQGIEILAKTQPPKGPAGGVLKSRIYVVGKRVYQTIVAGTAESLNHPRVTEFLDSFEVTG